jgi:CheY-like chemotaxis protein
MHVTSPVTTLPARASAISPRPSSGTRPSLLVVGDDPVASLCTAGPLNSSHAIEQVATLEAALSRARALQSGIVLTELDLPDGDGVELCKAAKVASRTVLVLVTTTNPSRVPRALSAGCDSVLLKPFAPNLLYARLGRLTRDLQIRSMLPSTRALLGTNQQWPAVVCPTCGHAGATGFDATSLRRSWYACLACEHVWIAKRQR